MRKPVNEFGVVALFSQYAQGLGYVIMEIHAAFPDATLYDIGTGNLIKVEFEYKAKNFRNHKHDPALCDLIICWTNDWDECPLPVLELDTIHKKEPIETVYDLSQKIDRLTSELSVIEIHANTEKDSRSDYRIKELELQKTKQEIGKLKSNLEKLKQQRKEDIKDVFETGNAKVKKYGNQELRAHSVIKCKKCGNALMEVYKDGKKDVLLDGTGKVKILFADITCENCGAEKRFYTDGKIAKKVYEL